MPQEIIPRIVWANHLDPGDIGILREQWSMALQDPNFFIVNKYEVHVDIGKEKEVRPRLTRFDILKRND